MNNTFPTLHLWKQVKHLKRFTSLLSMEKVVAEISQENIRMEFQKDTSIHGKK